MTTERVPAAGPAQAIPTARALPTARAIRTAVAVAIAVSTALGPSMAATQTTPAGASSPMPAASVPAAAGASSPVTAGTPAPVASLLPDARLSGEGELRWFGLKVYTAQLWTGSAGLQPDRLGASPFALELRYATALSGPAIAERSAQEIERMGFGDGPRRERWLGAMKALFPNVGRGDRLTGVNRPGRGVTFFHNDRSIGAVDDADFAAAFFAIWLDERTVAPALRTALLARASAPPAGAASAGTRVAP